MGQYFAPLLQELDINGGEYKSYDFENAGLKLTEHSWYNNSSVNGIAEKLYKHPMRCAWVGDYYGRASYVEDDRIPEKERKLEAQIGAMVEKGDRETCSSSFDFDLDGKYLVNLTTKQYVDCSKYKEQSYDEFMDDSMHPLPLLTACGNGRGGGDYHSPVNANLVGSWAMDIISIEDEIPQGFKQLDVYFSENQDAIIDWQRKEKAEKFKDVILTPEKLGKLSIEEGETYESEDGKTTLTMYFVDNDYKSDNALFERLCFDRPRLRDCIPANDWNGFVRYADGVGAEKPYINTEWSIKYPDKSIEIHLETMIFDEDLFDVYPKGLPDDAVIHLSAKECELLYPYFEQELERNKAEKDMPNNKRPSFERE